MSHSSTSSSRHASRTPERFALRLLVFCLPLIAVLLAVHGLLYGASEAWGMREVIDTEVELVERGEDSLFGRMIVAEEMPRYKLENIIRRKPKIVILGTSTVMQFRSQIFGGERFDVYNAGGIIQEPEHLRELAPVLRESGVRSVLLGVDFWWFNKNWRRYRLPSLDVLRTRPAAKQDLQARLFALRSLTKMSLYSWNRLTAALGAKAKGARPGGYIPIGLAAELGSGFRGSDGSRRYADFIERARSGGGYQDGLGTLDRIARRKQQFVEGSTLSKHTMMMFESFFRDCRAAGIQVAAVLPPLAPATYEAVMRSPDHASFLQAFVDRVPAMLEREQVPYVVATDLRVLGLTEANMLDGLHGSEVAMAKIMLKLLEDPAAADMFSSADAAGLRQTLEAPGTSAAEVRVWAPATER